MTEPNPSVPNPQLPDRSTTSPDPNATIGPPPMPIAALPYAYAAPRIRRPGMITSIGVISIVVASFSAIASLGSGCQAGSLYFISQISANMPVPWVANTSTASTPTMTATGYSYSAYAVAPGLASTSMPSTALTAAQVNSAVQAIIKIPLVLGGVTAATWMYADYYASFGAAIPGGVRIMRGMAIGWGVGIALAGLIYPISLLIVLNTDRMRNYFARAPLAARQ